MKWPLRRIRRCRCNFCVTFLSRLRLRAPTTGLTMDYAAVVLTVILRLLAKSQLLIVELASVIGEHPNFRNTINTHPNTLHETVYYGVITFIADNLCSGQSFKHVNIMKVPTRLAELMQVKSHNFIKGSGV